MHAERYKTYLGNNGVQEPRGLILREDTANSVSSDAHQTPGHLQRVRPPGTRDAICGLLQALMHTRQPLEQ